MTRNLKNICLAILTVLVASSISAKAQYIQQGAPYIDISHAPAPLFDDPIWHGATDPFVIWNTAKKQWYMYYTQRRGTLPTPNGVDWVHGSAIAIATSKNGVDWKYSGTIKGDYDLTEPLKAAGLGPEPGITWWAPCFLYEGKTLHMYVVRVDGVYTGWTGKRNIVHFTSKDGENWKFVNVCTLKSERVIDPTVYKIKDTWYMVYKDEAAGSHTFRSESKDLTNWGNPVQADADGSQEAPFVFHWKDSFWLMVDAKGGLRVYKSPDGLNNWEYNATVLTPNDGGTRDKDSAVGHHSGMVIQKAPNGTEQCIMYYFTQQRNLTWIQVGELELGADGKVFCNRNKYASTTPTAKN